MRPTRIIALVIGCLMLLPGVGLLFAGGALGIGYIAGRNDAGYFQTVLTDLHTPTAAIITETPALTTDLQTPTWLIDTLDTNIRLRVTASTSDSQIFVGIGPAAQVDTYLKSVAHDSITGLVNGGTPIYHTDPGTGQVASPPAGQSFWVAQTSGSDTQELSWQPTNGQWAVVIMNTNGSAGITAAATVEIQAGFLVPLAVILFVIGILLTAGAVVLIIVGATGRRADQRNQAWQPAGTSRFDHGAATPDCPIALAAHLDPGLSRWQWLVKWFLAIPHYVLLAFLWPAFLVVTVIAGFCILITGVYPRPLFDFTSGVLRWTWRVSYYAFYGGIGTDRYPPFTLGNAPGYPATLDIAYPAKLSRGLVLVKWWLLAIPQYFIVGLMIGNWFGWTSLSRGLPWLGPVGGAGILGLLVVIAGCILLLTGRYPLPLYNVVVGMNRWVYRVAAYAALMTDTYPPFRLDQGGSEPLPVVPAPAPMDPRGTPAVGSRTGA
jgi:hypothetical protein